MFVTVKMWLSLSSSSWFTLNNVIDLENDDTLHLVERQPQPSAGSSSGDATSSNGIRGREKLHFH